MKTHKLLYSIICALLLTSCNKDIKVANYEVVPLPHKISYTAGDPFRLKNKIKVVYPADNIKMQHNAAFLAQYINDIVGIDVDIQTEPSKRCILLQLDSTINSQEGYKIEVSNSGVVISGATEAGIFYGIQTLRKSLPTAQHRVIFLPAVEITDAPRFAYRGMHLDVARHFFSVDFVKRYIDLLAMHNINTLHWHLSDDQGWRIEIKQYPKLVEVGSQRKETVIKKNYDAPYDGILYGGFYTQAEAREIVEYAAERYITIIPEIDMPGHMLAALASYPELGCTGGPYDVWQRWGIAEEALCVGNPKTLTFAKNILTEIADIFPSEYIHIGGDECKKNIWKQCAKCQNQIKKLHIKADKEHSAEQKLQSYFTSEIEKHVNSLGRKIIGWDEILEGGVAPNATVMSWRGMQGGIAAAKLGHQVIMVPTTHAYFDYYQSKDIDNEPFGIGGYLPLDTVYNLEPVPAELSATEKTYIIGAQANIWTEFIATPEHLEYMVLPRMAALSEVQWMQPENKNYDDFLVRLPRLIELYKQNGYNYAKHVLTE